jgi:hypothetical protein
MYKYGKQGGLHPEWGVIGIIKCRWYEDLMPVGGMILSILLCGETLVPSRL